LGDLNEKYDDNLFLKVEGFSKIFNFFGDEMDMKMKKCQREKLFDKNLTILKNWNIFKNNVPKHKSKDYKQVKNEIIEKLGIEETPILLGLDNLLISNYLKGHGIHVCRIDRTGLVKSENGYFTVRRTLLMHNILEKNNSQQFFHIQKISEDDTFFFWQNWKNFARKTSIKVLWIYLEKEKYIEFRVSPENIQYNGFVQQYMHKDISQFQNHANGTLTAKQIMKNEGAKYSLLIAKPLSGFNQKNDVIELKKDVEKIILNQIWNENYWFPLNFSEFENENQFSGPPFFKNQFCDDSNQMEENFSTFENVSEKNQILKKDGQYIDDLIFKVGLKKNSDDIQGDGEKSDATSQTTLEDKNYKRNNVLTVLFDFDDLLSETSMEIPKYIKKIWEENQNNIV
jgi:hypothetical protein